MKLVPGGKIAEKIKARLKQDIAANNLIKKLVIIYAGENEASQIYVDKKTLWAKEIGVETEVIRLLQTNTDELLEITDKLNSAKDVSGYIIQLPLPKGIDSKRVLANISTRKDVDGLSPMSLGNLYHDIQGGFTSATALAVVEVLKYIANYADDQKYTVDELTQEDDEILTNFLEGKKVLVINHSILVGKPLAALLLRYKATVTIAHKSTQPQDLEKLIGNSEIVVSATGQSGLINSTMVHDGQILVDVGINKSALKIGGDIDPEVMQGKDIWLTPVPNGVGPITVVKLLENVICS